MKSAITVGEATNWFVDRKIFSSMDIYQQELERIFRRAWLYVGHESQIPKVGDFFLTKMGEDSMILVRDQEGKPRVMLNSCRHRGMKVCRYDEGNTKLFYCPYHAWSYGLDGRLVGLPAQKESYDASFDKSKWGLVQVAQVATFQGTIWATWDPNAPPLEEYFGGAADALRVGLGPWDAGDGEVEVISGVQKWIIPANWKIVAENCAGDTLHDISHRSVDLARIGPGEGIGRRDPFGKLYLTHHREGHGLLYEKFDINAPRNHYSSSPETAAYFQMTWKKRVERLGERAGNAPVLGNIFPSSGFHVGQPRTIVAAHPRGPNETELWRVFLVDKAAPPEVKDFLRRYYISYAGPAGMTEQDDMENWAYATEACRGTIGSSLQFHYGAAVGQSHQDPLIPGHVSNQFWSEQNARQLYTRWQQFMDAKSWDDLRFEDAR